MKNLILLLLFLFTLSLSAQEKTDFNLNFEKNDPRSKMPVDWNNWWNQKGYTIKCDSDIKVEGKYSVCIELTGEKNDSNFGSIVQGIPVTFTGKTVTLKGKMKTENVEKGYAGLLMRIDGEASVLSFGDMTDKQINGSTDWKEYTISLPLDSAAQYIYIAGILSGTGKMWIDDFKLTIDGTGISNVVSVPPKKYKAEQDREFDKGSGISITELNENSINNLFVLGRVWGFLKYYHPAVASGDYNWDYELFRMIPKVKDATQKQRDKILLERINSLSKITEFNKRDVSEIADVKLLPDLDWIKDNNLLSPELTAKLEEIRKAKREKKGYYIELFPRAENPKFKNENGYEKVQMDDGYRLLSLFRYWNMVEYFFPNRHLIGEDWSGVLKEFIPKFVNEKSIEEYHVNALRLIARIHDTHAKVLSNDVYIDNYLGTKFPVININFVEEKLIVTGYFLFTEGDIQDLKNRIKIGDEIISINGKPTSEVVNEKREVIPASNNAAQLRDIAYKILNTNDNTITLEFLRDGQKFTETLNCYTRRSFDWNKSYEEEINKPGWKVLENNIGYIYPGTLKKDSVVTMMEKLKDTKGIIMDFRSYPYDNFSYVLKSYFEPYPKEFVKATIGSVEYPGLFTIRKSPTYGKENPDYYKGKIILLINENTQSSGEYTTMEFRTVPNAIVIGSTTAGADGNVSEIFLPGGIKTMISGLGILTPEEKETQRIGIIPDIEVKRTIKGVKEGRDELMEKAIELIEK